MANLRRRENVSWSRLWKWVECWKMCCVIRSKVSCKGRFVNKDWISYEHMILLWDEKERKWEMKLNENVGMEIWNDWEIENKCGMGEKLDINGEWVRIWI